MKTVLRKAVESDRARVELIESQATPRLRYLPFVFDEFLSDNVGQFIVAEVDGEVVGCGKFTVIPGGSAWLEALRVMPKYQGMGIGKKFYERFFEIANQKGIRTMRMYTGVNNVVSKGLAERFGFRLAAVYRGAWTASRPDPVGSQTGFRLVTQQEEATELLMPLKDKWAGHLVMNRTFYELTPDLCRAWALEGKVYHDPLSKSVVALGARFMPDQALHIAAFGGNDTLCIDFANRLAVERRVDRVQCMFPPGAADIHEALLDNGFQLEESDCIVMKVDL